MSRISATLVVTFVGAFITSAWAQSPVPASPASGYLVPPQAIVDILDAPPLPTASISPTRQTVALLERASMPTIAEIAEPMLRLAGLRINPRTNGPHMPARLRGITLKPVDGGKDVKVTVPANPALTWLGFSPDGKRLAFTQTRDAGVELWVADATTGLAKALSAATLNAAWGEPCAWNADGATLLCRFIVPSRGPVPAPPLVPTGPNIQENHGKGAPVPTYPDLLRSAHDERLFTYYASSLLAIVDAATGARTPLGRAGLYETASLSPSGEYALVTRLKEPFSRVVEAGDFAKDVEVWNRRGTVVRTIADLPVADTVPNEGVLPGPRQYAWQANVPATLVWAEALDEGNPKNQVPHRDKLLTLTAPFTGTPSELLRTEYRFRAIDWTERGIALVTEYDRAKRWTRTWVLDAPGAQPRKLWDRSAEDAYANPGRPLVRPGGGPDVIGQQGDTIFVAGAGASPEGERPFLDRVDLKTLATERLFRSDTRSYESVVGLLAETGTSILTRYETAKDAPNFYVRALPGSDKRALTAFADPAPQLAGIQKQLLTYTRKDGVQLSATLYLPPGYKPGTRLPMLFWAYPREFTDPKAASQVTGSANRFTTITGPSHLLFLTQGYAVLDNPTMPIVGPGETANDTYVDQLVASAQAAVDTVVTLGVADPDRLVIAGHSYGAFMTANLLAHSDLFRAGIARSGAYNRTLTPFGFQNESRTFWEAAPIYASMSPFWFANRITEPILLIHGEADDNTGTFPVQSERFYLALKGHGATVRYVTLPFEAHGYSARESVLHTVAEMLNWADTHAKHAPARTSTRSDPPRP